MSSSDAISSRLMSKLTIFSDRTAEMDSSQPESESTWILDDYVSLQFTPLFYFAASHPKLHIPRILRHDAACHANSIENFQSPRLLEFETCRSRSIAPSRNEFPCFLPSTEFLYNTSSWRQTSLPYSRCRELSISSTLHYILSRHMVTESHALIL